MFDLQMPATMPGSPGQMATPRAPCCVASPRPPRAAAAPEALVHARAPALRASATSWAGRGCLEQDVTWHEIKAEFASQRALQQAISARCGLTLPQPAIPARRLARGATPDGGSFKTWPRPFFHNKVGALSFSGGLGPNSGARIATKSKKQDKPVHRFCDL